MLQFSKYQFQSYGQKTINDSLLDGIDGTNISMKVHDQGKTFLCWVFGLASSLKSSLKIYIESLPITKLQKIRCFEKLDDKNLHKTMRLEICMIIPTLMNVADSRQAMAILPVLKRVNK